MHATKPVMSAQEIDAFLKADFPQLHADGEVFSITAIKDGNLTMSLKPTERHLRPGGTISGPTLFALADVAAYAVILAHVGPVALAVTTNLTMNFLRRPVLKPLYCTARLLKLGKRLAVIEMSIFQDDRDELVAHATATYSIPPSR